MIFGGLVLSHGQGLAALAWSAGAYSACPPDTYYLDQACLRADDFRRLSLVSSAIRTIVPASDPILVYPYKNILGVVRSEEHTSELQSLRHLVCRLLLEKKKYLKHK